jgi:beta-glucosidase
MKIERIVRGLAIVPCFAFLLVSTPAVLAQSTPAPAPYLDPSLPLEQRVDDLVSRMTVEEKASQVVNHAAAIPRLQVPEYDWWSEALHGVARNGIATVFPEPIGLAATFDSPLIFDMATVIGIEGRAKHHEDVRQGHHNIYQGLSFWSPNLNIFRDPRWGRGQETYGEDPYLTGRMGVAFVTGLQGDDPKYLRAVATPKHYAVHSGPEPLRHGFDVKVSKHDEEDTYLSAFRAAITQGKAGSAMCVYNSVNGQPGCANEFLLEDQLRGKWNFNGYVVSDCDAISDIAKGHHFVDTVEAAAAVSMKRGVDLDCTFQPQPQRYIDAVKQGLLPEKDLDASVKRLFRARFLLGMFDPPDMVKYAQIPYSANDTEEHRQLALKAARESIVLLKNDGTLPLKATKKNILVIGPLADQVRVLAGNYSGTPSKVSSALDSIRQQFATDTVTFAPGTAFLRDAILVPASALSTPDGQPGVKAEYFKGMELAGEPAVTRVDPSINFNLDEDTPVAEVGGENFSARWTGFLTPTETGKYQFGLNGDDGYRVWLDGKPVVDEWSKKGASTRTATVELEKGHKYPFKVEYFQNTGGAVARLVWAKENEHPLEDAVGAAKHADVVIAVVGITSSLEGEEMPVELPGFKGGDRTSLDLPKPEEELLEAVKATGKPLVVVLYNGSALGVNWASEHANAILDAWYPGEEGGPAIAETLAGANNPSGRLPVTFYTGIEQLPPFIDYSMSHRTYRYFEGKPLYPFGYGLSYSKFTYDNLKLSAATINAGDSLAVDADVRNAGSLGGDEVAELYLVFPKAPGAAKLALRGFTRVHVDAGASQHVHFTLSPRDLSMVNESGDRVVSPGTYTISVGGGQPNTGASTAAAKLAITGEQKLPE